MPEVKDGKSVEFRFHNSEPRCAHEYLLPAVRRMLGNVRKNGRVLDLGCGNGSLSFALSKLGFEVHGVDRSESGIRFAREAFPGVQFWRGDVEDELASGIFAGESVVLLALSGTTDRHFTALRDGGHIKFWSRETPSRLFREKGFEDLRFAGASHVPYVWKSMILAGRKPGGALNQR